MAAIVRRDGLRVARIDRADCAFATADNSPRDRPFGFGLTADLRNGEKERTLGFPRRPCEKRALRRGSRRPARPDRGFRPQPIPAAEEGDHTTILRGTRRIEELTTTDSQLNDELLLLGRHLQG